MINTYLERLDRASIDIETGELYLDDRKITPDEFCGPIAPGTLAPEDVPPAVEDAIARHKEKLLDFLFALKDEDSLLRRQLAPTVTSAGSCC